MGGQAEQAKMMRKDSAEYEAADDDGRATGDEMAGELTPKLIKNGQVQVAVDAYAPFQRALGGWLEERGGYISDTDLSHHEGEVSWASLTVRVPADQFDTLVGWTEERVQVESLDISAQDVTAEWVDVQARIDNGRRAESRLQELLATETASLSDVLEVERELARVRGEIESAEGRMRVLSDRVGYATLSLEVRVNEVYTPTARPGFVTEASGVFGDSVDTLGEAGRALALLAVAVSPWLGPPFLLVLLVASILRSRSRRRRAAMAK